ncbi:MAG: CDP-glucose 4,6-dehydratase [Verrucomicrobiia bacterium]
MKNDGFSCIVEKMFGNAYKGKKVLVTGQTGFKGGWLSLWLKQLGAIVFGFSNGVPTEPSFYETLTGVFDDETITSDIQDYRAIRDYLLKTKPDVIFHLAAQPLVRVSYEQPLLTANTNIIGTINLLEAARELSLPCEIIVITSDKCYENRGWEYGYRETDPLGGQDVYSASKAAAEIMAASWYRSFFKNNPRLGKIATARAGNVIGGGDYARDRILPDCIRALQNSQPVEVRNPNATRPWQHVLDCLSGYLWLGALLVKSQKESPYATSFNFGPSSKSNRTVRELVEEVLKHWQGSWKQLNEINPPYEAAFLHLSTDRAAQLLKWQPTWEFSQSVRHAVEWYKLRHLEKSDKMMGFSIAQINQYCNDARSGGAVWIN